MSAALQWERHRSDPLSCSAAGGKYRVDEMYDHYPFAVVAWTPSNMTVHRDLAAAKAYCELHYRGTLS